jgi:hypothetical protein
MSAQGVEPNNLWLLVTLVIMRPILLQLPQEQAQSTQVDAYTLNVSITIHPLNTLIFLEFEDHGWIYSHKFEPTHAQFTLIYFVALPKSPIIFLNDCA